MTLREIFEEIENEEVSLIKKTSVQRTKDYRDNSEKLEENEKKIIYDKLIKEYKNLKGKNININFYGIEQIQHKIHYEIFIDGILISKAVIKGRNITIGGTQSNGNKVKDILKNFDNIKRIKEEQKTESLEDAYTVNNYICNARNKLKQEYNNAKISFLYKDKETTGKNKYYFKININGKEISKIRNDVLTGKNINDIIKKLLNGELTTKELEQLHVNEIDKEALKNNKENIYRESKAKIYTLREGTFTAKNERIIYNPNGTLVDKNGSNGADELIIYNDKLILIELKNWSEIRKNRTLLPIEKLLKNLNNPKNKNYSIGVIETRDLTDENKKEREGVNSQFDNLIKYEGKNTIVNNNIYKNYSSKELINSKNDYYIYRVSRTTDFINQVIEPIREQVDFYVKKLESRNSEDVINIKNKFNKRIDENKFNKRIDENKEIKPSIFTKKINYEKSLKSCYKTLTSLKKCCNNMKSIGFNNEIINSELLKINNTLNKTLKNKNILNIDSQQQLAASTKTKYFNY